MRSISNGPTDYHVRAYARTHSPFQNSDMMAPGDRHRKNSLCLSRFAARYRTKCSVCPTCRRVGRIGQDRALLRKASQLLLDAGFAIKDGKRVQPNGEVLKIEFLIDEPSIEPHHAPYIKNLGTLGIEASIRLVTPCNNRARWRISISTWRCRASACRRRRAMHAPVLLVRAAATKDRQIWQVSPVRHRRPD